MNYDSIFRSANINPFTVQDNLCRDVGLLRIFPSMSIESVSFFTIFLYKNLLFRGHLRPDWSSFLSKGKIQILSPFPRSNFLLLLQVRAFLQPPTKGVILQTFGAGNMPTKRKDIIDALKVCFVNILCDVRLVSFLWSEADTLQIVHGFYLIITYTFCGHTMRGNGACHCCAIGSFKPPSRPSGSTRYASRATCIRRILVIERERVGTEGWTISASFSLIMSHTRLVPLQYTSDLLMSFRKH